MIEVTFNENGGGSNVNLMLQIGQEEDQLLISIIVNHRELLIPGKIISKNYERLKSNNLNSF